MPRKNILILFFFLVSGVFVSAQTLDFYIQKGLENSPLLNDFRKQQQSVQLDSLLTLASLKPQVNLVSEAVFAPFSKNIGYNEAITDGGSYSAVVNVEQSLFNRRAKDGQFKTIALFQQSIEADSKITIMELKQGITEQYLLTYADYLQIEFNQSACNLLKEEQAVVKVLAERGIYAQTDLMNLSLSITSQELAIKQATIQFRNNLALLNYICGIADMSTVKLEKPKFAIQSNFSINSSPVMVKFKIDSLKSLNDKELIDLSYRPKVSAFANAGFMAIRPEGIPHNFGGSVGLNLSMPIYDGKQRELHYKKMSLTEKTRQDYQAFYTSQYKQQINQLTEQLELTDGLILSIQSQLSEQEKLISLYKIEIEKGLVRFLDFLDAVNSYTQTKNSLTVSEMNRLQIINQLNYLK